MFSPLLFPPKLTSTSTLKFPFPTASLATTAHEALSVDKELSPLVQRAFSISDSAPTELVVEYSATTNRMLRVAVNGFLESIGVVLNVMRDLDTDVMERDMYDGEGWDGVQGLEGVKG